ncbi:nuclear transport factor 2 family protein [Actinoplanes subtropicus]|uniref:nuclear transport factor 2 family protein n=1 Tax=Actinoplanes subtropicus TaxID=543632 RepID=UPI0004C2B371|nr:nuclear transport factor 2 family protein [Actinoplanes subtropicus]
MTPTTRARSALVAVLASTALLSAAGLPAAAAPPTASADHAGYDSFARLGYQKAVAVRVLKGVFEQGDTGVVDRYVRRDYIQHDPFAPDGAEALKKLGVGFHQQFPHAEYDVKRVIAEGDLVVVHSNVVTTPGTRGAAVFDIFRFQDGKIAEHWDVSQNVPETSANGNDMFSTESLPRTQQPGPAWLTASSKKVVTEAFDEIVVRKNLSAIDRYFGPEYHQHNPFATDGLEGAKAGLAAYLAAFPEVQFSRKRVIAEGDLVVVHSHAVTAPGEPGQAFMDLFRVRNGKVVEHWDVIQAVPETSANDNTMF